METWSDTAPARRMRPLVAERCGLCLVGNHDLAVLDELDVTSFSPAAAAAVRWTRETAKPATLDFLAGLEPADETREVALYHASPRDPVWEYVLWPDQAAECIGIQAARVSLVGHSHVALFFVMSEDNCRPRPGEAIGLDAPRAPRPATAPSWTSSRAAGCSTPEASASRATAIREPPGSSSTRIPGGDISPGRIRDRPGRRRDRRDRPAGAPGATPLRGPVKPITGPDREMLALDSPRCRDRSGSPPCSP